LFAVFGLIVVLDFVGPWLKSRKSPKNAHLGAIVIDTRPTKNRKLKRVGFADKQPFQFGDNLSAIEFLWGNWRRLFTHRRLRGAPSKNSPALKCELDAL